MRISLLVMCQCVLALMWSPSAQAQSAERQAITMLNQAEPWGGAYGPPTAVKVGKFVNLEGVVKVKRKGKLGQLPNGFRPPNRLVFNLNNTGESIRVDVLKNGEIHFVAGLGTNAIPLDGITFAPRVDHHLSFNEAFSTRSGGGFGPPTVTVQRGIGVITGLLRTPEVPGLLGMLPPNARPKQRQMITSVGWRRNAQNKLEPVGPVRLDVHADGRIVWQGGGPVVDTGDQLTAGTYRIRMVGTARYLTVRGDHMIFAEADGGARKNKFTLIPAGNNAWKIRAEASSRLVHINDKPGQDKAASTRWSVDDQYTQFIFEPVSAGQWRIKSKATGRHLREDANGQHQISTRTSSSVKYHVNSRFIFERVDRPRYDNERWISLNGVYVINAPAKPLSLTGGVTPYNGDNFAPPQVSQLGDLVVVSGLATRTINGGNAQLPADARPRHARIFSSMSNGKSVRLDIGSGGTIKKSQGTEINWMPLNTVVFALAPPEDLNIDAPPAEVGPPLMSGPEDTAQGANWEALLALEAADYQTRASRLMSKGYAIQDISTHLEKGKIRYTSLWYKGVHQRRWTTNHGLTQAQFETIHASNTQKGFYLDDFSVAREAGQNGQVRYAGIWREGSRPGQELVFGAETTVQGLAHLYSRVSAYALPNGRTVYVGLKEPGSRGELVNKNRFGQREGAGKQMVDPVCLPSNYAAGLYTTRRGETRPYEIDMNQATAIKRLNARNQQGFRPVAIDAGGDVSGRRFQILWEKPRARVTSGLPQKAKDALKNEDQPQALSVLSQIIDFDAEFDVKNGVLTANITLFEQDLTVIIYLPSGKTVPNVAVIAERMQISNFVPELSGTLMDELIVTDAVLLYVPKSNAGDLNTNTFPQAVRTVLERTRTGTIPVYGGQNVFARIHFQNGGDIEKALTELGVCANHKNQDCFNKFHVHAANGLKGKKRAKFLRLSHPTAWASPFRLKGLTLTGSTFEYESIQKKGGSKKAKPKAMVRVWGNATVQATRQGADDPVYFMFGQCVVKTCKAQAAFAFNAEKVTLDGLKDVGAVLSEAIFPFEFAAGPRSTFVRELNKLPLDRVAIEHPDDHYNAANNITAEGNPNFDGQRMLIVAAGEGQKLPYTSHSSVRGPQIKGTGALRVFGRKLAQGSADVSYRKNMHRFSASGTLTGFSWGAVKVGDLTFSVARDDKKRKYNMFFDGALTAGRFVRKAATVSADNSHFSFTLKSGCDLIPLGLSGSAALPVAGKKMGTNGWSLSDVEIGCGFGRVVEFVSGAAKKAFGVVSEAGRFMDSLLFAINFDLDVIAQLGDFGGTLGGLKNRVHTLFKQSRITYVLDGQVYGQAANFAGESISAALHQGWQHGNGAWNNVRRGSKNVGSRVGKALGSLFGMRAWSPIYGGLAATAASNGTIQCAASPIERRPSAQNLKKRYAHEISASSSSRNLRSLDWQTHGCERMVERTEYYNPLRQRWQLKRPPIHNLGGSKLKTRQRTVCAGQRSYECNDTVIPGSRDGAWWRLDLGDPEQRADGTKFHVHGVLLANSGGSAADRHGGLEGALVILTNADTLKKAVATTDLVYNINGGEVRNRRVFKLGAQSYHYVITPEPCVAAVTPETRGLDQNKRRYTSVSASRYVWIYQPKANVDLRINRLSVVGRPVQDDVDKGGVLNQSGLCACDYRTCAPNTGETGCEDSPPMTCGN